MKDKIIEILTDNFSSIDLERDPDLPEDIADQILSILPTVSEGDTPKESVSNIVDNSDNKPPPSGFPFKGFWERLKAFVINVEVQDCPGEEEKNMILNVCETAHQPTVSEEEIENADDRCPKCKSIYIMKHRYDDSYKICMSCKHNWRT